MIFPLDTGGDIAYYSYGFKTQKMGAMTMIFERIVRILAEQFGLEEEDITEETGFEELGADSVDS